VFFRAQKYKPGKEVHSLVANFTDTASGARVPIARAARKRMRCALARALHLDRWLSEVRGFALSSSITREEQE
jgi:hypothetical protein